jgi:hypothetical protein
VVYTAAVLCLPVGPGCRSGEKHAEHRSLPTATSPSALIPAPAPPAPPAPGPPTPAAEPLFTEIRPSALWRVCRAKLQACFPELGKRKRVPQLIDLDWRMRRLWSVRSDGTALAGYAFEPRSEDIYGAGPTPPPLRPRLRRLVLGQPWPLSDDWELDMLAYSCSIDDARVLVCFGKPWDGRFIDVAAGAWEACAIREDGTLRCRNWIGERPAPAGRFQQVGVGEQHACALDLEGTAHCWAAPSEFDSPPLEVLPSPSTRFLELAVGETHTCGLTQARKLECWGSNREGEQNAPPGQFEHIAATGHRTCGLSSTGRVQCWGAYF